MVILATALRGFVSVILTLATIVMPWLVGDITAPQAPLDSENCLLNFVTVSDLHSTTKEDHELNSFLFDLTIPLIFPDFEQAEEKYDAFVMVGDNTDDGYDRQWSKLENVMAQYDLADEILIAAGNHDTWTEGEDGRTTKGLFMQYNRRIANRTVGNVYYSTEINGYPFIVLCSEDDGVNGYFSDTQIKWLKSELKKAAKKDLPIFVICHWPINQTHGLPVSWGEDDYDDMTGGMGEQSDIIEKLLKKYDNVFLISGHIHAGFSNAKTESKYGYQSVESDGSFHSINLPRTNAIQIVGNPMIGYGYVVEVYEDRVEFRARNYMLGTWDPNYNYTIELV